MRLSCYDNELRHNIVRVVVDPQGDSRVDLHRINYKSMCLSAYWQLKLANKRARISSVMVQCGIERIPKS